VRLPSVIFFMSMSLGLSIWGTAPAFGAAFTTDDVAKHASKADCWMVIEGKVYDVTAYLSDHPAPPAMLTDYCGKDATQGWQTKGNKKKGHSRKASVLLKSYLKGDLSS